MSFLSSIKAALKLPASEPVKAPKRQLSMPSFMRSAPNPKADLPRDDRRLANLDTTTYRNSADTRKVIRDFARSNPDLSSAVWAYIRLAVTDEYVAVARNQDNTFNEEATVALQQVLNRFNVTGNPADGFIGNFDLQSISESWAQELMLYGSCAGELVLDKTMFPTRIQPLSTTQITFRVDNSNLLIPIQKAQDGSERNLDVPTFFYSSIDQGLLTPYSDSPIEAAIKPAIFAEDYINDLHRLVKKVIFPRQKMTLNEEKIRASIPADIMNDAEAVTQYFDQIISGVEQKINGLRPEDALVLMDSIKAELDNNGNTSLAQEMNSLQSLSDARLIAGSKSMGTILGKQSGSSNIASSEVLLFMKSASVITKKLSLMYSRILTMAMRIMGYDVIVEFKYADIDLRPKAEMAAFAQTNQQMVLELLSLGLVSDAEASLRLTGKLPPAGYKPLSGTMFKQGAQKADTQGNYGGASNDGSTLNKNLAPDTPTTGRGGNKKAEDEVLEIEATLEHTEPPQPTFITPNITVAIDNSQQGATKLKMQRDGDGNLTIERMADGS